MPASCERGQETVASGSLVTWQPAPRRTEIGLPQGASEKSLGRAPGITGVRHSGLVQSPGGSGDSWSPCYVQGDWSIFQMKLRILEATAIWRILSVSAEKLEGSASPPDTILIDPAAFWPHSYTNIAAFSLTLSPSFLRELRPVSQPLKLAPLPFVWTGCDWSEPGLLEPLMGDVFGLLTSFIFYFLDSFQLTDIWTSLVAQTVKNLSEMQGTQVWSLGQEDPLEKEMAAHSSILAWRIPWTEDPGGLQSMGCEELDMTEQ